MLFWLSTFKVVVVWKFGNILLGLLSKLLSMSNWEIPESLSPSSKVEILRAVFNNLKIKDFTYSEECTKLPMIRIIST